MYYMLGVDWLIFSPSLEKFLGLCLGFYLLPYRRFSGIWGGSVCGLLLLKPLCLHVYLR